MNPLAPADAPEPSKLEANRNASTPEATVEWWRLPIVWMVLGGPAIVVVASFATLTLAIRNPDPVLTRPPVSTTSELPAVQGRNHAATPAALPRP
jgi:hypothetical protein